MIGEQLEQVSLHPEDAAVNSEKPARLILVDREKLRKAQRTVKNFPNDAWLWKLCMHMVKEAYGINCRGPLPEIGECNGSFICTYVNKETGDYIFVNYRHTNQINYPELGEG